MARFVAQVGTKNASGYATSMNIIDTTANNIAVFSFPIDPTQPADTISKQISDIRALTIQVNNAYAAT